MKNKKICAVIPALNEETTIGGVVEGLKNNALVDHIIVVDDYSRDKTGDIARKKGALVIRNNKTLGYGKSINNGFKKAAEINANIIFTFDADGQHSQNDIKKVINPILKNESDIVVGIRPKKQRILERIFALYSKKTIGIEDPLCGLKAYNINAYNHIGYFEKIKSIGTELMFRAADKNIKIKQVKINMSKRYDNPRFGKALKGNFKILMAMLRIMFR